jgi:hypothetical protein
MVAKYERSNFLFYRWIAKIYFWETFLLCEQLILLIIIIVIVKIGKLVVKFKKK